MYFFHAMVRICKKQPELKLAKRLRSSAKYVHEKIIYRHFDDLCFNELIC